MAKWNGPTLQLGRLDEFLSRWARRNSSYVHPESFLVPCLSTSGKPFDAADLDVFLGSRGLVSDPAWEGVFSGLAPSLVSYKNNMKTWLHWLLPYHHCALCSLAQGDRFLDPVNDDIIDNVGDGPEHAVVKIKDPWLWVLFPEGYFVVMLSIDNVWKHSSLASGFPLCAAGELGFSKGLLRWMSLQSGHYMRELTLTASKRMELDALKQVLAKVVDAYWSYYELPGVRPRIRTFNNRTEDET